MFVWARRMKGLPAAIWRYTSETKTAVNNIQTLVIQEDNEKKIITDPIQAAQSNPSRHRIFETLNKHTNRPRNSRLQNHPNNLSDTNISKYRSSSQHKTPTSHAIPTSSQPFPSPPSSKQSSLHLTYQCSFQHKTPITKSSQLLLRQPFHVKHPSHLPLIKLLSQLLRLAYRLICQESTPQGFPSKAPKSFNR